MLLSGAWNRRDQTWVLSPAFLTPQSAMNKWHQDITWSKGWACNGIYSVTLSYQSWTVHQNMFLWTLEVRGIHFSTTDSYITNLQLEERLTFLLMWGYVLGSMSTYFMSLYCFAWHWILFRLDPAGSLIPGDASWFTWWKVAVEGLTTRLENGGTCHG